MFHKKGKNFLNRVLSIQAARLPSRFKISVSKVIFKKVAWREVLSGTEQYLSFLGRGKKGFSSENHKRNLS